MGKHGFFQHVPGLHKRHFSSGVGKVPKFENPGRRSPKTKELGGKSISRGPNKNFQVKISKNAILFLTGFSSFPEMVVVPKAFPENVK